MEKTKASKEWSLWQQTYVYHVSHMSTMFDKECVILWHFVRYQWILKNEVRIASVFPLISVKEIVPKLAQGLSIHAQATH
eukprot:m.767670 g.767670  ORF g.767670 m.767670 type:complete len:80 (-) comp23227_c0_seq35:2984-3223(-)